MLTSWPGEDMNLRREPAAIASALKMDQTFRGLFVEGRTDRLFIEWLSGDSVACEIAEIDSIDISVETGGNRARAVAFADFLRTSLAPDEETLDRVRVLVDADFDHLDDRPAALPLMLTDGRSTESYFLRESYFEKIFRFILHAEHVDTDQVYDRIVSITVRLAALRELDRQEALQLPFQAQKLKSCLVVDSSAMPSLRLDVIISELLRKAGLEVAEVSRIQDRVEQVSDILNTHDPMLVIHGHDLESVLGEIVQKLRYPRQNVGALMRSAFERNHVAEFPVLSAIVAFTVAS